MRRIGFRTAFLTTGNDTDAAWVRQNVDGNGNAHPANTVMWRIVSRDAALSQAFPQV